MKTIWRVYRDAYRGLPREVWLLSTVLLINRAGSMVLTFLTLYLTQQLGYGLAVAGQVLSVYGMGHLAGAFAGGWLCDRLGALRIQFLSLLLSGFGYLALEHVRSLPAIFLVTFFVATTAESFRPANAAALAAFSPPHLRTRAVALNRMALNLGFSIGPAVGGWLATFDYSWLFRVDGVTCVLSAFLLKALFGNLHHAGVEDPDAAAAEPELHPLRDRTFLAFVGLMFFFTMAFFQCWSTYPVYLNEVYGLNEARFGLLMMTNALMILAFEMLITRRVEGLRPMTIIGAGAFLSTLGLAVLPLGAGMGMAMVSIVILTVGEMLVLPMAGGWVANRAGAVHRGKYMGIYTMAWGLGFVFGPSAGSWIYQAAGPDRLWWLVGLAGAGIWLGCEVLGRFLRRPRYVSQQTASPTAISPSSSTSP